MNRLAFWGIWLLAVSFLSLPALGIELNPAELRGGSDKNPVAVLQNRYFVKTWRPEIGLTTGSFLNEAYTNTSFRGFRISLFMSEWLGLEYQSFDTSITNSKDRDALNRLRYRKLDSPEIVSPDPEVNKVYGMNDVNLVFAPFYGKLNLMDQMILYSDLYLTSGFSKVDTSQGNLTAANIGVGQRFYFLKSMSFRIDFKDRIYKEERAEQTTTKNAYSVDFGLSYFFL